MNYQSLRNALQIRNGSVTVDNGTLGAEIDKMLRDCFNGAAVIIHEAQAGPGDGTDNTVVLTGRSSFFASQYQAGQPAQRGLYVLAKFELDTQGDVHVSLRYTAIGDQAEVGWTFSRSFPDLPAVFDYARPDPAPSSASQLDELKLSEAYFFAVSRDEALPDFGADLVAGINFAGRLTVSDLMGIIGAVLIQSNATLTISGPVVNPPADSSPPLTPLVEDEYAWDSGTPVPGIYLRTPLNAQPLKLGGVSFEASDFRVYSPPSYAWMGENPTYLPNAAFTGKIVIPSAQVRADISVNTQLASGAAILTGNFQKVTVAKLASLVDFAGTGSLIDQMPDAFRQIGDALGTLELTSARIQVANGSGGLTVLGVSATIGMPEQVWRIWPGSDSLNIGAVYARFDVARPFSAPDVQVTVGGTVSIEGVPINVSATTGDGFMVSAELGSAQTIPLKALMQTYAPGVPPPSDLTIDSLALSVAPKKYYSFSTTLAQQPNPWTLPLGPTTLTVSDVSLYLLYLQGASLTGTFGGTIALGSVATMSMVYNIPGSLVLEANIPKIGLTDLAREIAGVASLPFPAGFPNIDLVDSSVKFTGDKSGGSTTYSFLLRTTVAVGSTPGFNLGAMVVKTQAKTGFAAAIWTPKWAPGAGWSPGTLWQPLSVLEIDSAGLAISTLAPDVSQKAELIPLADVPALAQEKFKIAAGVTFFATLSLKSGPVEVLQQIFGDRTTFDLYASWDKDTNNTTLIAHLDLGSKNAFAFQSIDLAWESTGTSSVAISLIASGNLTIGSDTLTFTVGGKISTDGSARLALSVRNWVHPFGYQRLTVKDFSIAIALADGVVIALQGTFEFTTKKSKTFLFGAAGAIIDFEAPSALAFQLSSSSPNQALTIGEVLEGITTIDIYDLPPETTIVPWILEIKLLDLFLKIQELMFWVVMVDQVEIGGIVYKKGFGLRGEISLFDIKVKLYLEVREADKMFAGSAEFPDEVRLGGVLLLSRPTAITIDSKQDLATTAGTPATTGKGPALAVSSVIDATHQYYLFVAAHVELFDIIKADIIGQATDDGIAFLFDLQAGKSGQGAWAAQRITVLVSREQLAFSAGLAYQFGLKNVTLGGFDLFGAIPIPKISLPDFLFGVSGTIGAGLLPPMFRIGGSLDFEFMGISLHPSFDLNLQLANAPTKLADFGALVLAWIENALADLMKGFLDLVDKFADWVKQNFEALKDFAKEVAQVLKDQFNQVSADVLKGIMTAIGWTEDVVNEAVDTALKICAMTQALVGL